MSAPEIKVGIVGFGEMGKRHALEYSEATRGKMRFPAVVEPQDSRYEEGCAWFGQRPARYPTVEEMLAAGNLDAVIISSPNCRHLENLESCIDSNLPVLLEKPLESSPEKIMRLARLAAGYPKPLMVNHVMRYAPVIQKARQVISSGGIGRVCSFNFVQYHPGGPMFSTFRRTLEGGGGHLVEKATHDLDAAFYLCGAAPRRASGISRLQKYGGEKPADLTCSACDDAGCPNRQRVGESSAGEVRDISLSSDLCAFSSVVDVFDNEACLVDCTGGVFGSYSHCYFVRNHFSRRYEIIGTEGLLYIELTLREKSPPWDGRITLARSAPRGLPSVEEYKFNYEGRIHYNGGPFAGLHFYDVVLGRAEPATTIMDAFAAEMTGFASMKSSREGVWVDIARDVVPEDLREIFLRAYGGADGIDNSVS